MVGSVRGKERLEIVLRVWQGGREPSTEEPFWTSARSVGGQIRLAPACTDMVGWPHAPQNILRVFQSIRARAWAYIAAVIKHGVSSCRYIDIIPV